MNDWVGRCIAEAATAKAAHAISLTYGRGEGGDVLHERAAVLTYSDVQKYFKLLRRHGFACRYFAIGEYGSMKGRAHWHIVVFWKDAVPDHELGRRFMERHWPHGFSFWDEPSEPAIRYNCKYIQKDIGAAERQGHLAMSKKPPLGHAYFDDLAWRYAVQGLAPQDPFYWFDNVRGSDGKPVRFYLSGVSLDNFCKAFLDHWAAVRGGHPPVSPLIEDFEDRRAGIVPLVRLDAFRPQVAVRPWLDPPEGYAVAFNEPLNLYVADAGADRLFWSFDEQGVRAWRRKVVTEKQAEGLQRQWRDPALYATIRDDR